jgi:iron complex transport system ATP-binding protein
MLKTNSVGLTISAVPLLNNISIDCPRGSVTALMGPNGAGKTSLLKVIAGEHKASQGRVEINGQSREDWKQSEIAQFMAVLPQSSTLEFAFTAQEVVALGRTPHATGLVRDAEIISAALIKVDASYLAQRSFVQLSGGEKQRVQLARVLAQIWEYCEYEGQGNSKTDAILLLDEPSAAFDLAHQLMLIDIVQQISARGVTVVMVMHDLNLAAKCADQMVFMNCGESTAVGPVEALLTPELIKKVFSVDAEVITHPLQGTPMVVV